MSVETRPEKPECLVCCGPPKWRYSLPEGFPLVGNLVSAGSLGLCETCRALWTRTHDGDELARRAFQVNPVLAALSGARREQVFAAASKNYARILNACTGEKIFVEGEHPFDRESKWLDADARPGEN